MNAIASAVARGASAVVFGAGGDGSDDGGVENLLERISNGVLLEDRREAMALLKEVVMENPQARLALGSMGLPVMSAVLSEERNDVDMVRGALETLLGSITVGGQPPDPEASKDGDDEAQAAAINAELFARNPESVQLLLSLLDEEDFYVRYHTVQLLTALLGSSSYRLQEAILSSPMGVPRLMEMMVEREVIRNEALLLLISLTKANEEIQKIVVFEGAFERLFNIVREEGAAEGGVVVQDCLALLNNLLRSCASNQMFLRESGFVPSLPGLLKVRGGGAGATLPRQKAANLLCALETIALLAAPAGATAGPTGQPARAEGPTATNRDTNRAENIRALLGAGALGAVLSLAVGEARVGSAAVRARALRAAGDLVQGEPAGQEALGAAVVGEEVPAPALLEVLRAALYGESPAERAAADHAIRCYCEANEDGQATLASTIMPVGESEGLETFGGLLVRALVGEGGAGGAAGEVGGTLAASCRAAAALAHLLSGNESCKERVLRIPLELPSSASAPPELLLPRCVRLLMAARGSLDPGSGWLQAMLLKLLVTWLVESPPAVAALLASPQHLPLLADLCSDTHGARGAGAAGAHVAGLAAVVLGVCMVHGGDVPAPGGGTAALTVLDVVLARGGLAEYFQRWDDLRRTDLFRAATSAPRLPEAVTRATTGADVAEGGGDAKAAPPAPDASTGGVALYDPPLVAFITGFQEEAQEQVIRLYARPGTAAASPAARDWGPPDEAAESKCERYRAMVAALDREMAEMGARNAGLAEDLMRANLEAHMAQLSAQLEEARGHATKVQEDMEGLSGAYNTLEEHSFAQESTIRDLEAKVEAAAEGGGKGVGGEGGEGEGGEEEEEGDDDDGMNDLLVCLGQEEAKVERLTQRLEELGEDVEALLEGLGQEGEDEEEEEEDGEGDEGEDGEGDADA